ncbi:hypothetical protein DFH07DRAFT_825742 [Mycena maculata]|uniref:Uncharacterized protein n=1 Tax=Mycena maculata TaxID=230809 RepID=A0AAD7IWC9_9AGAR|nr:hypothetical protein DFH07DRAFT_825742 [Mycena maculata]
MVQFPDSDNGSMSDSSDTSTLTEEEWRQTAAKLQKKLRKHNRAQKRGDETTIKSLEREIGELMRRLAQGHSDPAVRAEWARRADEFDKVSEVDKQNILLDIGKGLGIIVASPFILAGGVLYGAGLLTQGLGNLLTGGMMGKVFK